MSLSNVIPTACKTNAALVCTHTAMWALPDGWCLVVVTIVMDILVPEPEPRNRG